MSNAICHPCCLPYMQVICKMVCEKFTTSTVIIVSLDVETIIECDRIMVMEAGRIVELHEPHALLQVSFA